MALLTSSLSEYPVHWDCSTKGYLMNKRLNPLTEADFKKHIHPYLIKLKDGRGQLSLISNYDFFVPFYL